MQSAALGLPGTRRFAVTVRQQQAEQHVDREKLENVDDQARQPQHEVHRPRRLVPVRRVAEDGIEHDYTDNPDLAE